MDRRDAQQFLQMILEFPAWSCAELQTQLPLGPCGAATERARLLDQAKPSSKFHPVFLLFLHP